MSFNLWFELENGDLEDFPFQTPTELTLAVVDLDLDEAVEKIEEYLRQTSTEEWWIEQLMAKIKYQLSIPGTTLTYI